MTDFNAALMEKFLNVPVTQRKAVIEPDGVLDDVHRESVAVRLGVGHGGSAYPDPIKATQPPEQVVRKQRPLVCQDFHGALSSFLRPSGF